MDCNIVKNDPILLYCPTNGQKETNECIGMTKHSQHYNPYIPYINIGNILDVFKHYLRRL